MKISRLAKLGVVAVLAGGLVSSTPAAAAGPAAIVSHPGRPAAQSQVSVPVHPVAGTPVTVPASGPARVAAPVWPAAAAAVADRTAAAATRDASGAVRAGQLPVWVGQASAAQVGVRVADQAAATAAGVKGMLLQVWRADGGTLDGSASVSVDYSGFRTAYGADWATRLRVVQLPACALTTPQLPDCQTQAPLATSSNDYRNGRVTADVGLPAAPTAAVTPGAAVAAAPAASQAVVLAVTAGPSGPSGTYQATSLSPSATWQANAQTGDFTWSYPIQVPPGLGSLAPSIALSYDSGSVDGMTAAGNGEASWVGDGFDYESGFVERKYKACGDSQPTGKQTGDLCWGYDNATVMLNGQAMEIVKDDATGAWHLRNDNGAKVEHLTGASNGALNGEYWRITTTDGTQYTFGLNHPPGWASGKAVTNSTWTVPVFGLNSGDPCNASPGWCNQAWRWNLDLVVDPHGNAETFWYAPETNEYARGYTGASKGTPTTYTRGGVLTQIEYGERASNTYTNNPMRVVFNTADRCSSTATICDIPWDLSCSSGACANSTSPSFWTQKELTSIVTQVWEGSAYANVDTYALRHELKDDGDGSFPLTLDGITHTGDVGGTASLPEVTFGYVSLPNRVDTTNLPAFNRNRVSSIVSESGSSLTVTYSGTGCSTSSEPNPATNSTWCFPQWWDGWPPPPAGTTRQPDWFTKYLVTGVTVGDATGASPPEVYHYDYQGGGAWHYDDDTGLVKDSFKTWAQWRGFQEVVTTKGAAGGTQTQSTQLFMRGMNGDRTASGGTASVSVTDSQGASIPDDAGLEGFSRETITLSGAGGSELTAEVDDIASTQTAKSVHTWGTVTANQVNVAAAHSRTTLDAGRGVMQTEVDNTYDASGILVQTLDRGDLSNPSPRCTTYTYARNQGAYLLTYPSEVLTTATACGGSLPTDPHQILSDVRTSYDGQAWGTAPVAGGADATTVQQLATPGPSPTYVTTSTTAYDQYGRVTSQKDALNRAITTAFTPATGSAPTSSVATDPAGDSTTTTFDPGRGQPISKVDVNGKTTTLAYDPLGRLTRVWLPGQTAPSAKPNETYGYTVSKTTASAVATSKLLPNGSAYTTTYQLYDGQLRLRQTQAPDGSGHNGRVITDTLSDSRGLVAETTNPYYDSSSPPGATLVTAFGNTAIPGETVNVYDSAERQTASIVEAYGVEQWRTSTGYGGDRTTVTPPAGSPATTTIDDARGQTTRLCQYQTLPASGACDAGSSTSTTYSYYPNGEVSGTTDPAGNHWSYDYDVLGRRTSSTDPDTGTLKSTYDIAGQLTSTIDARGQQLSYVYDSLGHTTQEWAGAAGTGTELATWTYNTSGSNLEQLASSTSFVSGSAYTTTVTGYDDQYRPTGTAITIPKSEGMLAGTYTFGTTYDVDGSVASETLPASGGLPAETVNHTYDGVTGLPVETLGASGYVQESQFNEFGQQQLLAFGTSSSSQWTFMQYTYDLPTARLSETQVRRDAAPGAVDADIGYTYDHTGNVTSVADTPTSGKDDVQCFQYDALQRLTEAWAQGTAGCASTPSTSVLGGPSPYWEQFSYDVTGNRTADTLTTSAGTVGTTSTFPAPGQAQPHTLTGQTLSGSGGTSTSTYGYDAAGNTTTRDVGAVAQTLAWNQEGHLASVADAAHGHTTSYVYDANGTLLLRHDDATATLYLPDEELAMSAAGTVTTTRYYTHDGSIVAARTPAGVTWLIPDPHGTDMVSVDASSQAVAERRFTPFGAARSAPPASWPGDKGFVGGTTDPTTGLVNLGAREYDPSTGRFLSADPLMDPKNPQQMNGYAYSNNNPVTYSDPTGKMFLMPGGGGGGAPARRPAWHPVYFPIFWAPVLVPLWFPPMVLPPPPPPPPSPPPPPPPPPKPKPAPAPSCGFGGKAGFEMGCHGLMPTSHGNSGGSLWGFLKKAGSFVYHASGAADVVGCVTHPTLAGCAKAAGEVVLAAATAGDGTLARIALEGGASLAARMAESRAGSALVYAGSKALDYLNPRIIYAAKPLIRDVGGRAVAFPTYEVRPLIELPGRAEVAENVAKAGETFDHFDMAAQDTFVDLVGRIFGIK